jgi:bifunctional non-homologous end joining protein LigD
LTKSSTKVGGRGKRAARERDSSAGGLQPYRNKRDPRTSNEPFAAERIDSAKAPTAPSKAGTWSGDFVVHLHQASHRHFDLRMQIANRLLSFAIRKGRVSTQAKSVWRFKRKITRSSISTSRT